MVRYSLWIGMAACSLLNPAPVATAQDADEDSKKEIRLHPKRSPEAQARSAIRAGDFRVARLVFEYSDDVGHYSFVQAIPGLACDGTLGEASARDLPWGKAERRFAAAHNAALLADSRYPDRDVCIALNSDSDDSEWPDFAKAQGRPKAMKALGAKSCEALHGDESDKCRSSDPDPDPAL